MGVLEKQSLFAFLSLVIVACQPSLSPAAEMFDLSELSGSQQGKLWTQVDNWAVAVVLADFCKHLTALEERMTKVTSGCLTPKTIKTVLDRFHEKMDSVKEKRLGLHGQQSQNVRRKDCCEGECPCRASGKRLRP